MPCLGSMDPTRVVDLRPILEEWMAWYAAVRPHRSLDWDDLETPEQDCGAKSQDICLGNFLTASDEVTA